MKSNRLFLLPLLLLMASCSRYSEAEIKGVCSRYFVASTNSVMQFNFIMDARKRLKEVSKEMKDLIFDSTLANSSLPEDKMKRDKTFNELRAESKILIEQEEKDWDAWYKALKKSVDLYATILKIQGIKDVDYYRQFIDQGDKVPEGRYNSNPSAWDKFRKKEKKNIEKAEELFADKYSNSNSFCKSYGVERI